jgi:Flp pilus assembly protein TadG
MALIGMATCSIDDLCWFDALVSHRERLVALTGPQRFAITVADMTIEPATLQTCHRRSPALFRQRIIGRAFLRLLAHSRRMRQERDGAAAVEFALIAPAFLFILFAIVEVGLFFFAQQVMEQATFLASRQILTGQAQTAGLTQTQFRNLVCTNAGAFFTCANIVVDVQTYASYSAVNTGRLVNSGTGNVNSTGATYSAGTSGSIVVVRAAYEWPTIVRTFGLNFADLTDGNRLIQSTVAMRVE